MSKRILAIVACSMLSCPIALLLAQPPIGEKDSAAETLPAPPAGFDARRDGIDRGKLETVEYDSTTVGVKRKAQVYTPPGYIQGQEVPGPVPAARHRRRRERVATRRRARRDPRQPVRRQEGRADDRRHAQRPGVEGRDGAGSDPQAVAGVRRVREGPAHRPDPVHREDLLGEGRPRVARHGRAVDGRRAVAQLRAGQPRHVRLGRRLLLGPEHQAARRPDQGPRGGGQEAAAAVRRLRRQGRAVPDQPRASTRCSTRRRCRTSTASSPAAGTTSRCGRATCTTSPRVSSR